MLQPDLVVVDLPNRRILEAHNRDVEHVYFIDSGVASVAAIARGLSAVEVGLIGREGLTGLPVLMGAQRSPNDTIMQLPGAGRRISAPILVSAMEKSQTLRHTLLNFAHVFSVQIAQTALANDRCNIEARLARWLAMAQDRLDTDELPLTHEFIAIMLGVRRPGVTVALNVLEKQGLIETRRGTLAIIDRDGLITASDGSYGVTEAEMHRLFG